jgi:hypothetical protein
MTTRAARGPADGYHVTMCADLPRDSWGFAVGAVSEPRIIAQAPTPIA